MESNSFAFVGAKALASRDHLLAAAAAAAHEHRESRMAEIGAGAVFQEALLGALHAHLAELKLVAR
ncbi:MAG: hypothetical protein JO140_04705 [Candidatus Eremiobacteraeota bacterium]|nr:hypothetical protein [Candidatus Eremiobacteraeota bacterium]